MKKSTETAKNMTKDMKKSSVKDCSAKASIKETSAKNSVKTIKDSCGSKSGCKGKKSKSSK